jgi:hypothetical protein
MFAARWAPLASMIGIVLASGCGTPKRNFQPAVEPNTLPAHVFVHYLATVPVATVDEGCRAVLLLTADGEKAKSFPERRVVLQRLGAWHPSWSIEEDRTLDQGTLAFMLRVLCAMPRGVSESLLDGWGPAAKRYALRTCSHEGVLPYGQPHQPVGGGMLQSALTRAESYISQRRTNSP